MKSIAAALVFTLFALIPAAKAGTEVTNGGDAVVCRDSHHQIRSAALLDFYEAPMVHGYKVDFGSDTHTLDQNFAVLLERIRRIAPMRADLYAGYKSRFAKKVRFVLNGELVPVDDASAIFAPKGCKIEQVALHRDSAGLPDDAEYFIDSEIWKHLPPRDQAGLLLHEFSYQELIAYGHTTSVFARSFTSYIAADQQAKLKSQLAIYSLFKNLNFAMTDFNGVNIIVSTCPNSVVPRTFCPTGDDIRFTVTVFGRDGHLISGWLRTLPSDSQLQKNDEVFLTPLANDPPTVTFYPSGSLRSLGDNVQVQLPLGDLETALVTRAEFYDSFAQHLHCAVLGANVVHFTVNGVKQSLSNVGIELSESGDLLRTWSNDDAPLTCQVFKQNSFVLDR